MMSQKPQSIQSHRRYGVKVLCETILGSERSRFQQGQAAMDK